MGSKRGIDCYCYVSSKTGHLTDHSWISRGFESSFVRRISKCMRWVEGRIEMPWCAHRKDSTEQRPAGATGATGATGAGGHSHCSGSHSGAAERSVRAARCEWRISHSFSCNRRVRTHSTPLDSRALHFAVRTWRFPDSLHTLLSYSLNLSSLLNSRVLFPHVGM